MEIGDAGDDRFRIDRSLLHDGTDVGWGNLGYWRDASTYAGACEAMAGLVGEAAGLVAGDRVLDVAVGGGASCAYFVERFGVDRVVGLDRVAPSREDDDRIRFVRGDAAVLDVEPTFDAVVCVDAAYHFSPRTSFFAGARRVLRDGGTLALTDIVLAGSPTVFAERAIGVACDAMNIPRENLRSVDAYRRSVEEAGFRDVVVRSLDPYVFEGFAGFVGANASRWILGSPTRGWPKLVATGLACRAFAPYVHYVLVSGRRR